MGHEADKEIDQREQDQPRLLDTITIEKIIHHDLLAADKDGTSLDMAFFIGHDLASRINVRVTAVEDGVVIGVMLASARFDQHHLGKTVIRISSIGMFGRIIGASAVRE